jgi:D-xylonolactonase
MESYEMFSGVGGDLVRPLVRAERDILGEGPLYSSTRDALFWLDIKGKALNRLCLASGAVERKALPEMMAWLIEREDGRGFVCGIESGFAMLELETLSFTAIADPEPDAPDNRLNDAKADSKGRIFAGTMHREAVGAHGSLYRLDPNLSATRVDSGYGVANGPAFNSDQTILYHTDTVARTIYAFDLHTDGSLSRKRPFVRFEGDWGFPDGMTLDAEGGLWVAHWDGGRISRFLVDGTLDRSIAMPCSRPTSLAFGGEDFSRLFVTSAAEQCDGEPLAGALFEVAAGVRGLAPGRFGG